MLVVIWKSLFCLRRPSPRQAVWAFEYFEPDGVSGGEGNPKVLQNVWTYADLKRSWTPIGHEDGRIPRYLFRTGAFKMNALPDTIASVFEDIVSDVRDYQLVYFDNDDCEAFIKEHFPIYLDAYNAVIPGAYKADLWRLLVLYKYGGVYNDIEHRYLVPLADIIPENTQLVVVRDDVDQYNFLMKGTIYNAFMAACPNHPVIRAIIDHIVENINRRHYGDNVLDITGPQAVGRAFNAFFNRLDSYDLIEGQWKDKGLVYNVYKHISISSVERYITKNGVKIIQCKFPDYYTVMYKDFSNHYSKMWESRDVYKK